MKNINKAVGTRFIRPFFNLASAILIFLGFAIRLVADAPPALTTIRWTGTDFEGRKEFRLEWDATPDTLYRLQRRTGFESNATWEPFDLATPAGTTGVFRIAPEKLEAGAEGVRREFFRVLMPAAEIFRIEPALVSTNGGTAYLFGQCLGTNATLRVGGLVIPPNTLQPGSVYSFEIVGGTLPEGTYDVEVLDGTNVIATASKLFSVTGQPTPVGEAAQRLLEIPEEPPGSPVSSLLMPALMKAKEKANRTKCGSNLRTMPATGELQLEETDLFIPGRGLDFVWTRTYRSRTGINSSMGQNWSHSYDIRTFVNNGGVIVVLDGAGRSDSYYWQTNGVYTADELFNEVTISNGVVTVTFPDTGKWEFNSISNTIAPGRISRCVDRNGNALTFHYDASSSRLLEIVDTLNRTNRVSYDFFGRVASVTDFSGRTCTYTYWRNGQPGGGDGDLRSVTSPPVTGTPNTNDFPLGKTTIYTYSHSFADDRLNHNLLTVTDPLNQTWLTVEYDSTLDPLDVNFDRVTAVHRGFNPPSVFTYMRQTPAESNHWAVMKTICNDPVGNVTIDWFDSLNRGVVHRDLAARATPGTPVDESNLPTKKLRLTDPDFWETRYEWNLDSLCTRIVFPRSNSTEVVYQRAMDHNSSRSNKSRRSDGNPRVIRERACCADADQDGADDLVTRLSYDGRFGNGPRQSTSIESAKVIMDRDTGRSKGFGFIISSTDPRGNVDTAAYDANGNRVLEQHHGYLLSGDDKPVTSFEYNSHGQLTAIVNPADANGYSRRDEYSYYNSGAQNGYCRDFTVDATGPTIRITGYDYDAVGNLTQLVHPRGNTNLWIYNALNQVVRQREGSIVCNPCGPYFTDFFYDANDNLVRTEFDNVDASGLLDTNNPTWTTLFEYDELNRRTLLAHEVTHTVQQRFATNRFAYDGNDNLIETRSPEAVNGNQPGNTIACEYDTRRFLWRQTSGPFTALASTDEFDYDENGNKRAVSKGVQDPTPATYSWSYDGFDRCVTAMDAMGNLSTFTYDGNGNLISERHEGQTNDVPGSVGNRRLAETRYEYDSLNRRARTHVSFFDIFTELPLFGGDSITTFSYAPNGACRSVTDEIGRTTRYAYDQSGRLITTTDPKTNTVRYAYDPNDNVIAVTQGDLSDLTPGEQRFVTRYEYDELNRCVVDFDNVGNTNRYGYDSRGNVVSVTDPNGNQTTYVVDGLGLRVRSDCCSAGAGITINTTHTEYDDNGRRISFTDANTNTTRFAYDALNRCIATTNADNTVESLVWSPRSNVSLRTDPNGTVTTFSYDANDRCVRKDIVPGGGTASTTTFEMFTFDGMSRCVLASNDVSLTEFSYNSMGDCVKQRLYGHDVLLIYDQNGRRTQTTYPSGRVVNYTYDTLDQVTSLSTSAGGGLPSVSLATFAYEGPGRLARITRGNGVNTRWVWNGLENPKNAAGDFGWQQVSGINHQVANGGVTIDRRIAAYDRNQNKTLRQQVLPFPTGVPALTTNIMTYDALNRMSSFARNRASSAYTKSFALDGNGNRQTVSSNGVVSTYTMDATLPEPADFQMNQYTATPVGTHEYDHNGNMVFIPGPAGGTSFSYDYANRLVEVSRTVGPASVPIVSFAYDALGRRICKTKYPTAPELPVTTLFILDPDSDDDGILEERENGTLRKTVVFPHVLEASGRIHILSGGEILYSHVDELGSALALTDANTNVVERYDYDEYGSPRFLTAEGLPLVASDGTPATESLAGNEFLFQGMIWDGETGLYLTRHRPTAADPFPDPPNYMDSKTGGQMGSKAKAWMVNNFSLGGNGRTFASDNPWSQRNNGGSFKIDAKKQKQWLPANFRTGGGGHGGGGGGGCGGMNGISIDEPGVHFADVMFNPKEYSILKKEEGGRHTPFHNRMSDGHGYNPGQPVYGRDRSYQPGQPHYGNISFKGEVCDDGDCDDDDPLYFEQTVITAREAGSGLATGRRSFSFPHVLETSGSIKSPRDSASGQATGKRQHKDHATGLATGKRQSAPRDPAYLSTRLYSPRDVASGLPTGKRIHSPRDPASGLPTGRRQYSPIRF